MRVGRLIDLANVTVWRKMLKTGEMQEEPTLTVGVLEAPRFHLSLRGSYKVEGNGKAIGGPAFVRTEADGLALETESGIVINAKEVAVIPSEPHVASFVLNDVVIGKQFHWQRAENQRFRGGLRLVRTTSGNVAAINTVKLEDYLASVISSEMSGEGAAEFLKAHAIASRSWLIAQISKSRELKAGGHSRPESVQQETGRLIRWYDREDHELFDVCADDHCQRYQGITRPLTAAVERAVHETRGTVLMSKGMVCDARFSKCCGGVTERYDHVWEAVPHSYLTSVRDADSVDIPDLTAETGAAKWITSSPSAFCNVRDVNILDKILPRLDRETQDFFRWKVKYHQQEIAELIRQKSGIDFGGIKTLLPVRRGSSGRLEEMTIVGTKRSLTVGKELEIRRLLSASHLFSSAFIVNTEGEHDGLPDVFTLSGAGWGHGVGLCQIGAGVMGERGYTSEQILAHYFAGATVRRLYD